MRDRSLNFTIWILGFAVALIWILLKEQPFCTNIRVILTFIVMLYTVISFWFLCSIQKGFNKNRELIIKMEKIIHCYDEGVYTEKEILFPKEYGEHKNRNLMSHFKSIYILLFPIAILLVVLIWIIPYSKEKQDAKPESKVLAIDKQTQTKQQTPKGE